MDEAKRVMDGMLAQIKQGDFDKAAELGNQFSPPLGVSIEGQLLGKKIYAGQQGTVHEGLWQGRKVAVKKARISTSADMERFRAELRLMVGVGSHHNVVPLLAARALPPGYMLLLPFLPANLGNRLHVDGWRLSWGEVLDMASQLAEGLAHIHACGILHRDVKPANVMLGEDGTAKISDFGIAELASTLAEEQADRATLVGRHSPSGGFHKRHLVGTLEYLAPEVLLKQPYSFPADVYAWAVTVNEVATGVVPFSDCTKDNPAAHTVLNFGYGRQELAAAIVSEGLRPHMDPGTPEPLARLLEECWQLDHFRRPTAQQLKALVEAARLSLQVEGRQASALSPSERKRQEARKSARNAVGNAGKTVSPPLSPASEVAEQVLTKATGSRGPAWIEGLESSSDFQLRVTSGSFATPGLRGADRMEDRLYVASPMADVTPEAHLLAVFDGHRGPEAASFAASSLESRLQRLWGCSSAEEALKECFTSIDADFCSSTRDPSNHTGSRQPKFAGCTAIAALLLQSRLWVANAGDCRAVLCRAGQAVQLNSEHTASSPKERLRVEAAGGCLRRAGDGWRIGDAGIQVTRSIGDADLKSSGLVAEPEVTETLLSSSDSFLVLASDGLWDAMSGQEAVDLVHDTVKDPAMCAQRLATEAMTRGSGDNISVVVAFLQPVDTLEEIYRHGRQKYGVAATHHGNRRAAS